MTDWKPIGDCPFTFHGALFQFHGSSTNELVETTAPQQIHNAGHCEDFTNAPMRKSC
jgi:hypothetical protein